MAGRSRIQNEPELIRWFEEGRTYEWMAEQYRTRYKIDITPSAFGNWRHRHGLQPRTILDSRLIPWEVSPEHRQAYPLAMLRVEARIRAGADVRQSDRERVSSWKETLARQGAVVHCDPRTEQGWWYVPRRPVDLDLIRKPDFPTTHRKSRSKSSA